MIPAERLSIGAETGEFQPPREGRKPPLEDTELGGVGINDSSQGLQVARWDAYYDNGGVYAFSAEVAPMPVVIMSRPDLVSFSFTFDQNMQPAVAWETASEAGLYWFDTTIPGYTDVLLPAGARTPRCTLDDKRAISNLVGTSDIILVYLLGDELYFRAQRDRFLVDYLLGTGFSENSLEQVGMGTELRLLLRFQGRQP